MRALKLRGVALIAAAMVARCHGLSATMATSSTAIDAGDPLPYHNRPFPRHDEGETIPTASVDGAGAGSAISPSSVLATDYDATTTETFDFVATTRTTFVDDSVGIETDLTDFVSTVTRTISEGEITMTTYIDVIISTPEIATEEFTSTTTQTTAAAAGTTTLLTTSVDPPMSLAQAASPITKSPTIYAATTTETFTITDTTMTTYVSESAVEESKPALMALAGEAPAITPPSNPLPPPPNEPNFGFIGVDKSLMIGSSSATAPKSETTIGSLTLVVLGDDGTSTTTASTTGMLNKIDQEPFYHATHVTTTNTITTASEVEMETVSWSTIGFVTVTTTTSAEEGTGTLRPSVSASEEVVLTYTTSSSERGTVTTLTLPMESGTTTGIVLPVHSSAVVESAAAGAAGCGSRWFDLKTTEGLVGCVALSLAVVWVGLI